MWATHVVGGEITYQYKGGNRYAVRLDLFIDCLNGNPGAISSDATAFFNVFYKNTRTLVQGYPVEQQRSGPERIVKLNYNCLGNMPNACVDHYWYEKEMILEAGLGDYIISFQRCCRNGSITNLDQPLNQGANYWTTIPDPQSIKDTMPNSSAVFKELPPNFLCVNAPLKFDHSATDADGDSLEYDLFFPYIGATPILPRPDNGLNGTPDYPPFQHVTYSGKYTDAVPLDGNPQLTINAKTGALFLIPTKVGQYVVGIRVREFRKGVLVGETKRDYQFNVLDCKLNVFASFASPSQLCDTTVAFKSQSVSASSFHWDFGLNGISTDTSNLENPVFNYPSPGLYKVSLEVTGNNCRDTATDTVRIGRKFKGNLTASTAPCAGKTTFVTETKAHQFEILVNGKIYNQSPLQVDLPVGAYVAQLVTIDTLAACNDTFSSSVVVSDNIVDLRLANVFTPNGDSLNDCFHLAGDFQTCLFGKAKVFNRWGELVFSSPTLEFCWNGKVQNTGPDLPEGVYFYQLELNKPLGPGGNKRITGSVNLIR